MRLSLRSLWRRLRAWLAERLGPGRGQWQGWVESAAVSGWTWWALPWQRREWRCALYQPPGLAATTPAPLVLLLHGCKQQAQPFARASGWVQAANQGGLRLLCPQQRKGANLWGCWNWFHPAAQRGRGELDVVMQALARAQAGWPCTDVLAVGLSAGGGLAALLAFHHAEAFTAVATMAAPPLLGLGNLQDPRAVMRDGLALAPEAAVRTLGACAPLLVLQGAADTVVNPRCGEQLTEQAHAALTRQHGPLTAQASPEGSDWLDAEGQLQLRRLSLPGLGHVWSGGLGGHAYVSADGPDLTAQVLAFWRARNAASSAATSGSGRAASLR